jgi:hypothetical protein
VHHQPTIVVPADLMAHAGGEDRKTIG